MHNNGLSMQTGELTLAQKDIGVVNFCSDSGVNLLHE